MKTKAIIFDVDSVIIHSDKKFSNHLENDFGITLDQTADFFTGVFQECLVGEADLKKSLPPYLRKWGWKKSLDEFLEYWFESENHPDLNLIRKIQELREGGIICVVGTKQEIHRTNFLRKEMKFEEYFEKIYSSAEIGYKKPDLKFFEHIFDDLQKFREMKKEEILFFDDQSENVEGGNKFGIRSFLYKDIKTLLENIES